MSALIALAGGVAIGYLVGFRKGQDHEAVRLMGVLLDMDMTPLNAGDRRHLGRK